MSYRRVLMLSLALAAAPATHAETLYVIEQLVVNVNSASDASGERVASIKSGDTVEVLERQGDEVHVRLANGTEGWVRKSYLSAEEPLQHRLNERTTELEQLKQEVKRLEAELAAAQAATRAGKGGNPQTNTAAASAAVPNSAPMSRSVPPGKTAAPAPADTTPVAAKNSATSDPTAAEPSYFMTPPETPARPAWHWAVGSAALALALGFALGWQALDRRIRRKYGGLRIY